jgi:hypothetical protein
MRSTIIALALAAVLAGCGSETGDDDVAGQDQTSDETTSTTAPPTGPPWPEFPHDDYTFVYSTSCYCVAAGAHIEVTVVDDELVEAAYVGKGGRGVEPGDPVAEYQLITMDVVIDHANTEDAAQVTVEWPAGQDYPDSVWVDLDEQMADEELGYTIHRVTVG